MQVAEGEVTLNGELLKAGDTAALSEETLLEIKATQSSQVLVFDLD